MTRATEPTELPPVGPVSRCRSCGAPIVWAVTERGRRMPLDAQPVVAGNIEVSRRPDGAILATVRAEAQGEAQRYVSHFSTCPQAGQHRRRR